MTPDEILQGLYDETLVGNAPRVLELTEEGLALGMEPQTLLFDALIPSLEEVGARFERGDFFVPGDAHRRPRDGRRDGAAAPAARRDRRRRPSASS